MNGVMGVIFASDNENKLNELTIHRTTASLPFCGRYRLIDFALSNFVNSGITQIGKKSWIFLILSGLATGLSWLCYYKALQMGEASKVVPIDKLSVVITLILAFVFLHEDFTWKSAVGCVLIGAGTLLMVI